jgi:hypothetical protein
MGGVDLADNYLHFYGTSRCRVKKIYMKIFHHMSGKDHYIEPFEIIYNLISRCYNTQFISHL